MPILHTVLSLLTLAAFVGLCKPYITGLGRKHFAGALVGLMLANAATLPFVPGHGQGSASSPEPTASAESTNDGHATTKIDPNAITPYAVGASLKAAARDPDSLVIEKAWTNPAGTFVCVEYRARNGFGGMNREHAVFTKRGGDTSASSWNKHCTSDDLTDVTYLVKSGTSVHL